MRRLFQAIFATVGYAVVFLVVGAAALVALARLLLPAVDSYRAEVEAWASAQIGQPVRIGALNAELLGIHPTVVLEDVSLLDAAGARVLTRFDEARIELDPVASWRQAQLVVHGLGLAGAELTVVRQADGAFRVRGLGSPDPEDVPARVSGIGAWLMGQRRVAVRESRLHWVEEPPGGRTFEFRRVDLELVNRGERHQLDGAISLPARLGGVLEVALDIEGDLTRPRGWRAHGYLEVDGLRPADWLALPPVRGVRLAAGATDLRLWGSWRDAEPVSVEGEVAVHDLVLSGLSGREEIAEGSARVAWRRRADGWTLDVDELELPGDGPSRLRVERDAAGGRLMADRLVIDRAARLAALGDWLPAEARERLAVLAPQGIAYALRFDWGGAGPSLQAELQDAGFEPTGKAPGIEGLDARVRLDSAGGELRLFGNEVAFRMPWLFRDPLRLQRLEGEVVVRRAGADWVAAGRGLRLSNADIAVEAGLRLDLPADGDPFLDLRGRLENGRGVATPRYLPVGRMPDPAVEWLDRAFLGGTVPSGRVLFHGPVPAFPFDGHEGRFEVRFQAEDADLDYKPGWPNFSDIDGEVVFSERRMTIRAHEAHLYDTRIGETVVTIPNLDEPVLHVDGRASGLAADLLRFVAESPLEQEIGGYTGRLAAAGAAGLRLDLTLPLDDKLEDRHPRRVAGEVVLDGTGLRIRETGVALEEVAGRLAFTEHTLAAEGITARMFGRPATLDVATENSAAGERTTRISGRGGAEATALAEALDYPVLRRMEGRAGWRGVLEFARRETGAGTTVLHLQTDLTDAAVDLPAPVGKPRDAAGEMALTLHLAGPREGELHLGYGDAVAVAAVVDGDLLERADVAFGGEARLPERSLLRMTGSVEGLDLAAWGRVWSRLGGDGDGGRLPPVEVAMERLRLAPYEEREEGEPAEGLKRLSTLEMDVARLAYGGMEFGRLVLRAEGVPGGLRVARLDLSSPTMEVTSSGRWNFGMGRSHTYFDVLATAPNLGRMMDSLGFVSVITEGDFRAEGSLNWPGTPADVGLQRLNGVLKVRIADGIIEEVEKGASGRLLGLLSVRALPRRLTLDFKDLTEKGLRFQTIEGDLVIDRGNGYTDNLQVKAETAAALVSGRTGLVAHDFDQEITVIPNISGSLPVAGGLAWGPQVGAILLILREVLEPGLEKVIRYRYRVTGTWEDPKIELVGGPDKEEQDPGSGWVPG